MSASLSTTRLALPRSLDLPRLLPIHHEWFGDWGRGLYSALERHHQHVAEAVEILANHRILVGTRAEQPAPTGSGCLMVVTDEAVLEVDLAQSDPAWVPVTGAGAVGGATGNGNATALQGRPVSAEEPNDVDGLVWNRADATWRPGRPTSADHDHDTRYVKKAGDTMSGDLVFASGANLDTESAVDLVLARAGTARVTIDANLVQTHGPIRADYSVAGALKEKDSGGTARDLAGVTGTTETWLGDAAIGMELRAYDWVKFGINQTSPFTRYWGYRSGSGAPTTALLTTGGDWCLWEDTTDNKMGWFYNDGGTIKEVGPRVPAYSGAKARHGSSQNITASTWTTLTWNNEYWDTGTYHDNSTNPTRLTVPRAGRYRFMCNLIVDYSTTSGGWTMWQLLIRLNGSGAIDSSRANTYIPADHAPEDYAGIGMTIELTLSASDYLELRCRQRNDSASTLTVIGGGGDDDSWFSVEEIV